jgi:NAD(P)-dependent dehydrogenase (short-subunit alcohol dehydrogenase family)
MPAVFITGSQTGLGKALTECFAGKGWTVYAGFHLQRHEFPQCNIIPIEGDVSSTASIISAIDLIQAGSVPLALVICNAGIAQDELLPRMTEEAWEKVLQVNLRGAFGCARAAVPVLRKAGGGQIFFISSYAALHGAVGQANYAAAKAGLIGLAQSIAREEAAANIRANVILPGVMETGMLKNTDPQLLENFRNANVLGRLNDPAEVARFIFALSEMTCISGQVFQLDSRIASWC